MFGTVRTLPFTIWSAIAFVVNVGYDYVTTKYDNLVDSFYTFSFAWMRCGVAQFITPLDQLFY